jgi:Leucine Rich repeat
MKANDDVQATREGAFINSHHAPWIMMTVSGATFLPYHTTIFNIALFGSFSILQKKGQQAKRMVMQEADVSEQVNQCIQAVLADESLTALFISSREQANPPPVTAGDVRRMMECLRDTAPRIDHLSIRNYRLDTPAVLNVFRNSLPSCTSVTTVDLWFTHLGNEDLESLLPAFHNTSVTRLHLWGSNSIQGQRGGDVLRDLLVGNNTLLELTLSHNRPIGVEGAAGLGQGLFHRNNTRLQNLTLWGCSLGNEGFASLLHAACDGTMNNDSLTYLSLGDNNIEGAEGGRLVELLLLRFPALKVLNLSCNNSIGPLGARALAPGLAAATCHLESLDLSVCGLGDEGVADLVPDGQVSRSLTHLNIQHNNIRRTRGGENVVITLATRCTNLDHLNVGRGFLNPDQRHRLGLLLERKRLCNAAQTLAGSTFPVLFNFVEEQAHSHEHGLSAIFVILQNDGEDHFCTAHDRTVQNDLGEYSLWAAAGRIWSSLWMNR